VSKRPRGPLPGWRPTTDRQVGILADVLAAYRKHAADDTLPRPPRGIFYDLRPGGHGHGVTYRKPDSLHPIKARDGLPGFGPMEAHPAAVQEVIALARRAGMIPEQWVADARAPDSMGDIYDTSAEDAADTIVRIVRNASLDLDPQRFQPVHVEVLCEAAGLIPRLARIANPFGVSVFSGSGFDGLKGKRAFAERALELDMPTVVLRVADRDWHGDHIYKSSAEDSIAWTGLDGAVAGNEWLEDAGQLTELRDEWEGRPALLFVRLALTTTQAITHDLLDADGKAEADGVPVPVMDGWVRNAIEGLQDPAARERLLAQEEADRARLPGLIRERLRKEDSAA
jgi:hypothetical protein